MKRVFFLASVWIMGCLADQESPIVVQAHLGNYDGYQIHLQGEVSLDHGLGVVQADQAWLFPSFQDCKTEFTQLRLSGGVHVLLDQGGCFHCADADVDFLEHTGVFFGSKYKQYVTYTGTIDQKERSIVLRGKRMSVVMEDFLEKGEKIGKHHVQEIVADESVTIDYNQEFMAAGDHLIYRRVFEKKSQEFVMPGTIDLTPKGVNGICQVANFSGDMIRAEKIAIHIPDQTVWFFSPKGAIYFTGKTNERHRLDFSANNLCWNHRENILTLKDHVVLYQSEMGKLLGNHIQICQDPKQSIKTLKWIRSTGKTEMSYSDPINNDTHYLLCHGQIDIDAQLQVTTLQSPVIKGKIGKEKQVFFRDKRGSVYADQVRIIYDWKQEQIFPKKIVLLDNVRIMNRMETDGGGISGKPLQYALADRVEYDPVTKKMKLLANDQGRVLVYDRVNNVQVSAPAVHVERDCKTGKEKIQGIGDVRFSFADTEKDEIIKRFSLQSDGSVE